MGKRKVIVKESVAESIAKIAWFIESKGMVKTAEKFSDAVYDFFETLADERKVHAFCRDEKRKIIGMKCLPYKKKYTIVFLETDLEIVVSEFIPSKLIY
jgi:plasmid stabilization system protein ParE